MTVSREQMQNVVRNYNIPEEIGKISNEMYVLRDYINDEFRKVSRRYNCVVPRVDDSWYFTTQNYNKV
jgi:hypothetical protein